MIFTTLLSLACAPSREAMTSWRPVSISRAAEAEAAGITARLPERPRPSNAAHAVAISSTRPESDHATGLLGIHRLRDGARKLALGKGLGEAREIRRCAVAQFGKAGGKDDREVRPLGPHCVREFDPVHLWHREVGEEQVDVVPFEQRERLGPRSRLNDAMPEILEHGRSVEENEGIVVDCQNRNRPCLSRLRVRRRAAEGALPLTVDRRSREPEPDGRTFTLLALDGQLS